MRELHLAPRDISNLGHQKSILLAEDALIDIIDGARSVCSGFKKTLPLKVDGKPCDVYVVQLCIYRGKHLEFVMGSEVKDDEPLQHHPYAAAAVAIACCELDANFLDSYGLDVEWVTGKESGSISLFIAFSTVPGAYGTFSIEEFATTYVLKTNDVVDFLLGRDWSTDAENDVQRFLRESYCLVDDLEQRVIDCSQLYFEHQDRVAQLFPRTGAPGDYEPLLPRNHYWPNLMPLHLNEFWLPNNRTVQAFEKMRRRVLLPSLWRPGQTVVVPARAFGEAWERDNPGEYAGTILELDEESAEEGRTWLVKYKEGEPHPTDECFFAEAPPWLRPTTHVAMEDSEPEADAGADGTDDAMEADAAPAEDAVMAEAVPAPEAMPTPRIRFVFRGTRP